jgi:hypothetical protein
MKEAEFKRMVEARHEDFEKYRSRDLQLYVRLEKYAEERENFSLTSDFSFKKKLNQVHVYENFWIEDSKALANHLDDSVNDKLAELPLVSLVSEGTPQEFKGRNNLNMLFPVYQVKDGDGVARSIVFGLDALLAHSLVFWKSAQNDDDELFIL